MKVSMLLLLLDKDRWTCETDNHSWAPLTENLAGEKR